MRLFLYFLISQRYHLFKTPQASVMNSIRCSLCVWSKESKLPFKRKKKKSNRICEVRQRASCFKSRWLLICTNGFFLFFFFSFSQCVCVCVCVCVCAFRNCGYVSYFTPEQGLKRRFFSNMCFNSCCCCFFFFSSFSLPAHLHVHTVFFFFFQI